MPTWNPPGIVSTSIVVSGSVNTTYLLSGSFNGCPLLTAFNPLIVPSTSISAPAGYFCATPNAAYSLSVTVPYIGLPVSATQTWAPPVNSTASVVSVNYSNTVNPVYTVTTSVAGCTNVATYTATWIVRPMGSRCCYVTGGDTQIRFASEVYYLISLIIPIAAIVLITQDSAKIKLAFRSCVNLLARSIDFSAELIIEIAKSLSSLFCCPGN